MGLPKTAGLGKCSCTFLEASRRFFLEGPRRCMTVTVSDISYLSSVHMCRSFFCARIFGADYVVQKEHHGEQGSSGR